MAVQKRNGDSYAVRLDFDHFGPAAIIALAIGWAPAAVTGHNPTLHNNSLMGSVSEDSQWRAYFGVIQGVVIDMPPGMYDVWKSIIVGDRIVHEDWDDDVYQVVE